MKHIRKHQYLNEKMLTVAKSALETKREIAIKVS